MGEGRKGERRPARRPPILPRGERMLVYFLIGRPKHVPELLPFSGLPKLAPVFALHLRRFSAGGLDHWLCPACLRLNVRVHTCKPLFKDGGAGGSSAGRVRVPIYLLRRERRVSSCSKLVITIDCLHSFFYDIPVYSPAHPPFPAPSLNQPSMKIQPSSAIL